jgi:UDP-glucose 4-epimerase
LKCVVLGGGGFIGTHLSEALLASDHEVIVFDRPDARYFAYSQHLGASLFPGDFLNPNDLRRAISDCDVVYHLVSTTVPQTSNENPYYDVEANVMGTLRLLEAARIIGIKKVIFVSSGGTVYGIPQEIPIKEGHPTEPTSSYGICKLSIEKYLHLYWILYRLDYCILRVSNAYGERQPTTGTQGVIANFLNKALHHEELIVWGDGSVIRDYIYANDIAGALLKAATYKGELKIFNIGAGQGHSLNDIINSISQVIQKPLQPKYVEGRIFDIPTNVLDISRAKAHLNWQPKVGLLEGISRTFEWMANE